MIVALFLVTDDVLIQKQQATATTAMISRHTDMMKLGITLNLAVFAKMM